MLVHHLCVASQCIWSSPSVRRHVELDLRTERRTKWAIKSAADNCGGQRKCKGILDNQIRYSRRQARKLYTMFTETLRVTLRLNWRGRTAELQGTDFKLARNEICPHCQCSSAQVSNYNGLANGRITKEQAKAAPLAASARGSNGCRQKSGLYLDGVGQPLGTSLHTKHKSVNGSQITAHSAQSSRCKEPQSLQTGNKASLRHTRPKVTQCEVVGTSNSTSQLRKAHSQRDMSLLIAPGRNAHPPHSVRKRGTRNNSRCKFGANKFSSRAFCFWLSLAPKGACATSFVKGILARLLHRQNGG